MTDKLRMIALGGLGEIGRNMLVLEYDENIIIIDAGLMFPMNDMLGIDIVIPDLQYVFDRVDQVKAIIITHGHEDHLGALPYLLDKVRVPIYATRLTRGLIEVKLREAKIGDADLRTIAPNDVLDLSPFKIEFFHVSHSIPDGVGLAIDTPVGLVVHSGDFKFDHSPVDGQRTDFAKLADLGGRGVLLLLADSTNSERPGYTPSEQVIGQTFERVFESAEGRVIVATFASNISRVQQVLETARAGGRHVAVVGRSMVNNVKIARDLGYLHVPDDVLVNIDQIGQYPEDQVVLVCTGSQGEPTSALVRMSRNDFRSVQLMPGDTVIVSASPIPGNEELINRTLDNLFRLGAHVYYDEVLDVHVSGHASQEEQKLLLNLTRPKFFVPIHGEYRHLILHSRLARQCGVADDHAIVMETGDVLEIDQHGAEIVDSVSDSYVFVDGLGVGGDGQSVLNERRTLSGNGFLVVSVSVDKYTNGIVGEPQVVSRGFVYEGEAENLLALVKSEAIRAVELGGTRNELTDRLSQSLSRLAHKQTGRQPIVVPIVTKV